MKVQDGTGAKVRAALKNEAKEVALPVLSVKSLSTSKHGVIFKGLEKLILQGNNTHDLQLATFSLISFPLIQLLSWPETTHFSSY